MNKLKFTKGPWFADFRRESWADNSVDIDAPSANHYSIATVAVCMIDDLEVWEEGVANANLIAAAPEMYEFIESLYIGCCLTGYDGEMVDEAKAILAKARGEL